MKVVIAGSRNLTHKDAWLVLIEAMKEIKEPVTEIVSGKATGIDTLGERYARLMDIPIKEFPANWNKHGKAAGPIRNKEMADYCDLAVIIWDGVSPGSKNMIGNMNKLNKPYILKVVTLENNLEDWIDDTNT